MPPSLLENDFYHIYRNHLFRKNKMENFKKYKCPKYGCENYTKYFSRPCVLCTDNGVCMRGDCPNQAFKNGFWCLDCKCVECPNMSVGKSILCQKCKNKRWEKRAPMIYGYFG